MNTTTMDFLNLFFNKGETICVSDCQGGYHSVEQDLDIIELVSPVEDKKIRKIKEKDINLVAINPVNGFRRDVNVTSFRSFLVEIDEGSVLEQKKYIESTGLPYSVCVFSGNKSLHYGIVLDNDLPDYNTWRLINKWILNIIEKADQQTLNPTRSIRFPGNIRKDGRKLKQSLVEIKGRVKEEDLYIWLNKHLDKKPKPQRKKKVLDLGSIQNRYEKIPKWVVDKLKEGIDDKRNDSWFRISCALGRVGYDEDEAIELLEPDFMEESDFSRNEWIGAIKSGIKKSLEEKDDN